MKNFSILHIKSWLQLGMFLVLFISCLAHEQTIHAQIPQKIQIMGTVKDAAGVPIIGATISEKQSRNVTISDEQGNFTLQVSSADAILVTSYLGMKTSNTKLNGRTYVRITLQEDTNLIDEIVVIGYGTVKKSDLTGSVSSVDSEIFDQRMVTSVGDALRGQIPGVSIVSQDGQPGQGMSIRIRGTGSINASSAPLYVVDGVLMESLDVSPGDIATLEILKDASATAIYGSRGANGVVLITTKQGKSGKTKVSVTANVTVQQPVRLMDMMDSYEYAKMRYQQTLVYWKKDDPAIKFLPAKNYYKDSEGNYYGFDKSNSWSDYSKYADKNHSDYMQTDWQRAMLRQALTHDYRINISGGDAKTTFSVMAGFFQQDGIVINSGYRKVSVRSNIDRRLSPWAKMGLNLTGNRSFQDGMATRATDGVTMNMLSQPPTKKLTEEEWEAVQGEDSNVNNNPWYQANNITNDTTRDNFVARLYFDLDFTNWLKYRITGNYTYNNQNTLNYYPKDTNQGRSQNGRAQNNTTNTVGWTQENLLYFTPNLKTGHSFDAVVGAIFEENVIKTVNTETQNFSVENLGANALHQGTVRSNIYTNYTQTRMSSFLARANYNYHERYLFTASLRFDGSSRFGAGNKWGIFPSGAFAWRVTEEKFMKKIKDISNLKLRLSYGVSGNTAIPALQSLDGMSSAFYPMDGNTPSYGIKTDRIINPSLKWETSTQYNAGIDLGLFDNRLTMVVDLYLKQTRDLLFQEPVHSSWGYTSQWSNIGAIDNKGLEFSIAGIIFNNKNFKWDAAYNMAFNRSKVVNMGSSGWMILNPGIHPTLRDFGYLQEGGTIGNWYGYQTDGVWCSQSEIDALPDNYAQNGVAKKAIYPGYTKFVDQNGDSVINEEDRVILGNGEPLFSGGFNNVFSYRNFSLNIGLEFSYGFEVFNATAKYLEELRGANNQLARSAGYWTPTLYDITTGEIVQQGNEDSGLRRPNGPTEMVCTDRYIEDGSYLRINDITLSYSLPQNMLRKIKLQKLSFYFSVKNAYVWTKYTGYDPDVSVASGNYGNLMPHLDYGAYPRMRGYTFGMNLNF